MRERKTTAEWADAYEDSERVRRQLAEALRPHLLDELGCADKRVLAALAASDALDGKEKA